jgi:hypothetical protein
MKLAGLAAFSALLLLNIGQAQETTAAKSSERFARPVRLKAGELLLGEGRLYPSPVLQDVNGDSRLDIVVGDLMGILTVALRLPGDGPARFGPETRLKGADGKDLKFHNW